MAGRAPEWTIGVGEASPILHRYNFYLNGETIQAILNQIFNTTISTMQFTF